MNDPYMLHRNRPDAMSAPAHPGPVPRGFRIPTGRVVIPYRPAVAVTPPSPGGNSMYPPPPPPPPGGTAPIMADTTFDLDSSDRDMRGTLATLVRRLGGKVVDTTPEG